MGEPLSPQECRSAIHRRACQLQQLVVSVNHIENAVKELVEQLDAMSRMVLAHWQEELDHRNRKGGRS